MDGMESRSDSVEEGITELEDKAEDILTICHRKRGRKCKSRVVGWAGKCAGMSLV